MAENKRNKFLFLIFSFLLTIILRVPYIFQYFSNVDEPEYALCGYKLLKGRLIYKEIFENKGFGLGYIYFFFMKFFLNHYLLAIHLFYLFILFLNTFLIFKIVEKKLNKNSALLSLIFYPALNTLFYPMDIHKGPEFIVVFLILLGWFLILNSSDYFTIFISAILIGFSIFFKQFGIILLLGFSFLIYFMYKNLKKTFLYFLSGIFPFFLFLIYLFKKELVQEWIEWNIKYPIFLSSCEKIWKKIYFVLPMVGRIFLLNPFLLIFPFMFFKENKTLEKKDFVVILTITFIWGSIHGLPFPHHYTPFFTILIITAIIGYATFISNISNNKKIIFNYLISFSILQSIFYWHGFDYYKKWGDFIRNKEWEEKFEFSKYENIIRYIKENTEKEDKIIAWGFNPKIYLLSNREPGTRFIILDPVIGQTFVTPPIIRQYPPAERLFLNELKKYKVKLFIDATDNSLINMSFFKIEKYQKIKEYLNQNFLLDKIIDGCVVYRNKYE